MSVSAFSKRLILPVLAFGLAAMLVGFVTYRVTHPTLIKLVEIRDGSAGQAAAASDHEDCPDCGVDHDHSAGGRGMDAMSANPELVTRIGELMGELQAKPDDFAVRMELAEAFMQVNDPAAAAQHLQKAVELEPKNAMAHYYLGIMLYALQRYEESVQSFEKSLSLEEDPYVMFNLALILLQHTDREAEALALLERTAVSDEPELQEGSRMILEERSNATVK